ncbi:hypothetical protein [Shinella sp. M27]|uniref:hypothetical protein n=1 Tax=Shinella sp. M27 TaxID=3368614 RepID=UPI003B9E9366
MTAALERSAGGYSPFHGISPADYDRVKKSLATPKDLIAAPPVVCNFETWNGSLSDRRLDVVTEGLTFECFGTPREAKKLFIFPSSAGRKDTRTAFHRVGWHSWFDGICFNIEDPTYKALNLAGVPGWFFGTKEIHALPLVLKLIRKVQHHYGIPDQDVHFIGSSSGGFASLWLANEMSGATAMVGNPQFYATRYSTAGRYRELFDIDLGSPEFYGRINLDHIRLDGASRFLIVTNSKSKIDFKDQVPFFLKAKNIQPLKYGLNECGSLSFYCKSSDNRGPIDPHNVLEDSKQARTLLDIFTSSLPFETKATIMDMLHEMDYTRQDLSDKRFFAHQWHSLTREWDLPLMLEPSLIEKNSARFPFVADPSIYFELKIAPKGAQIEISLRTADLDKTSKFEALANTGVGTLQQIKDVTSIDMGKHPIAKARQELAAAVNNVGSLIEKEPIAPPIPPNLLTKITTFIANFCRTEQRREEQHR